ncbi:hypothetical protein [Allosphingosinicella deserti]|uniref:Uncharacterized protein n=1 Tax=Allosphingosinicella deserti TaxID=2116704 RepID=A0A2P7QW07_9SPHN|nr:hypothetical protein [Sphingomonas deserti]PSJ42134.1 hypothetical protein C7I55_07830 [Sphingomonas deserti]
MAANTDRQHHADEAATILAEAEGLAEALSIAAAGGELQNKTTLMRSFNGLARLIATAARHVDQMEATS